MVVQDDVEHLAGKSALLFQRVVTELGVLRENSVLLVGQDADFFENRNGNERLAHIVE